jgi:hypothetical protein
MKKRLTTFGVLVLLAVVLVGCANVVTNAWSYTGMSKNDAKDDSWAISAKTVDGYASRSLDLNAANLAALHVDNTNSEGKVFLVLTQGDTEKTFDISGKFNGEIDTSAFEPGKIKLRLNFEKVKDLDLYVKW